MLPLMGNPGPRHRLVTRLLNAYPHMGFRLSAAGSVGMRPHRHALVHAGPTTHEWSGEVLEGDVTVRAMSGDKAAEFVHVEVQSKFTMPKFLSLRAYHASEVLKSGCGGTMVVISPSARTAAKFRETEARLGAKLDYRGLYLSTEDLAGMAAPGRPFEERALVAALTDYATGIKPGTLEMLSEMETHDPVMGDLFLELITDECPPDDRTWREKMSPELYEKLRRYPVFTDYFDRATAEGRTAGIAEGLVEGRAAGKVEGRVQALRNALRTFFEVRGDEVSLHADVEIATCGNSMILQDWLDQAYRGSKASEIFDAEPANKG
jgi:hypothetical protein